MANVISEEFVEFLRDRTRGALRLVGQYHANGYELVYLRDDLQGEYSEYEVEGQMDSFRRDAKTGSQQEQQLAAGHQHCSIRVFDETIIFNIHHEEEIGTIISLDPVAGRELLEFIGTIIEELEQSTDIDVGSQPDWL